MTRTTAPATGTFGFTPELMPGFGGLERFHPPYEFLDDRYWGFGEYADSSFREAILRGWEATADPALHSVISGKAPKRIELVISRDVTVEASPVDLGDGETTVSRTRTPPPVSAPVPAPTTTWCRAVVRTPGLVATHVNPAPGSSSVTTYSVGGSFGCSTLTLDPSPRPPASSRFTLVTVSVHSGQRSTSLSTSQTRSGDAWISTSVLCSMPPVSRCDRMAS